MSIPQYFEFTRPVLNYLAKDKREHSLRDIYEAMGKEFKLTPKELAQRLPGGSQTVLENRVAWAKQDLYWAGLISRPRRGIFQITPAGEAESKNSAEMNRSYLLTKFPIIKNKLTTKSSGRRTESRVYEEDSPEESSLTPEEMIAKSFAQINETLVSELMDSIAKISPYSFERVVVDLLESMGYGGIDSGSMITQKSNDEGIDGIINQDKLGLDVIYLQAKRWQNDIGRKEIQSFVGALAGKHATKGVFITTSKFCKTAIDYVKSVQHKVILIDGDKLANLMIEYDVGVNAYRIFKLKRIDSDYFENI